MGFYIKIIVMDKIINKKLKQILLKKVLFSAKDARKAGIYPSLINYYVKKGYIARMGRGMYKSSFSELDVDFQWEDLVTTAKSVPNGVVCLLSALALYKLTDEIPRRHWIAVPHATTIPKRLHTKFIRFRDMKMGKTKLKIGKEEIQIFNRERTIIDSFRLLSAEVSIKALKEGLKESGSNKISIKRLQQYAKKQHINITSYILAVTT